MHFKLYPRCLASVFHFRFIRKSPTILSVHSVATGRPRHHKKFSNMADVLEEYRKAVKEQVMIMPCFEVFFIWTFSFDEKFCFSGFE